MLDLISNGVNFIYGTNGNDTKIGSNTIDYIYGYGGNDILLGKGGNDRIYGGSGDDYISGGSGIDRLDGGTGNDTVSYWYSSGGWEIDLSKERAESLSGSTVENIFSFENANGSKGDDVIYGTNAANVLLGYSGADDLYGKSGNDTLKGGWGDDFLSGGSGSDKLFGNSGNDILRGGVNASNESGYDNFTGGAGADEFSLYGYWGNGFARINDYTRAEGDKIALPFGPDYYLREYGSDTRIYSDNNNDLIAIVEDNLNLDFSLDFTFFNIVG